MRGLFIIIVYFSFGVVISSQTDEKLIFKIKEYQFNILHGQLDTIGKLKSIKQYDKNGHEVLDIVYCTSLWNCSENLDSFITKYEYFFNAEGQLIKRKYYSKGERLPWSMTTFSYLINSSGQLIEKTTLIKTSFDQQKTINTRKEVEIFKYDKKNRIKKNITRYIEEDYSNYFKTKYKYDNNGNVTRTLYKKYGKKEVKKYKIEKNEQSIKFLSEGPDTCGYDTDRWGKKYDENGKLIEILTSSVEDGCTKIQFIYNEKNELIKKLYNLINGPFSETKVYEYNENGYLSSLETYLGDGRLYSIFKYVYEYY